MKQQCSKNRLMTHRAPTAHVPPGHVALRVHVPQFGSRVGTGRQTASFRDAQIGRLHACTSSHVHRQPRVQLLDALQLPCPDADAARRRALAPRLGSPPDNISRARNRKLHKAEILLQAKLFSFREIGLKFAESIRESSKRKYLAAQG